MSKTFSTLGFTSFKPVQESQMASAFVQTSNLEKQFDVVDIEMWRNMRLVMICCALALISAYDVVQCLERKREVGITRHHNVTSVAQRHHNVTSVAQRHHNVTSAAQRHHKATSVARRRHNVTSVVRRRAEHYEHVWPDLKFGWRIVVGSIVGSLGAAFGSVGGVGGGGIFVPMLTLIIGFDAKSSTALSKCMITGASVATVYYNLKRRHPTLDLPIIDYDLALLIQPMLVLGISIGVGLNVLLAYWMITILLIVLFLITSTKAFLMGIETWKKETIKIQEVDIELQPTGTGDEDGTNCAQPEINEQKREKVPIIENVRWKEIGLLCGVWISILSLQIAKSYTTRCSRLYWLLNLLQFPVAGAVSVYEAVALYRGKKAISSKGDAGSQLKVHQLVLYCASGLMAGIVGGLLGLGGGFILGPVFLELGIPPQVSSATATFVMVFSSSTSVVEYYLLKRFPVPYALYLMAVAAVASLLGQHVVRKAIEFLGRASLIIFILALTIFISAIFLGGVGLSKMVEQIHRKEYMGFESMCRK